MSRVIPREEKNGKENFLHPERWIFPPESGKLFPSIFEEK